VTFKPALIIPIYNHKETIGDTVGRLAPLCVPIYIVDDGSDAATQAVLADLAGQQPQVRLYRQPQNCGKGAAVMLGMRQAFADGFTHAVQIDADGQHDTSDVPRFFERASVRPETVIAGKPLYDDSAPKARLYGRLITHFWVWVETLSFAIGDSMCGFRLYPLTPTIALINRVAIPERMNFDTEIIVRLMWDGISVENIATRVIYPPGGLSHFDMLRDNLRISWMHTRLCGGMLPRLPLLLWRKLASCRRKETHWSRQQERGSALGMGILVNTYKLLGNTLAHAMLWPIVTWHLLTGHRARAASIDYLTRLHRFTGGQSPCPGWRSTWRHLFSFAESALDKLGAWIGRIDHATVNFPNRPVLDQLLASGRGALLIGAHFGNLEMMRGLAAGKRHATINAVVYTEHAQRFVGALAAANERFRVNLIQINHIGPDTAIMLREKIDRGELLVIVGDRTPPAENGRVISVDFLGEPALLPQGPYILASLLECQVFLFFCVREPDGYRAYFEQFADKIVLPRNQREAAIAMYANRYAKRLEELCRKTPLQWFNFFDFWRPLRGVNPP